MTIGIRELKNRATEVLRTMEDRGIAVVVARRGRPTARLLPIDSPEAEDYVLSHASEIVSSLRAAGSDLRRGKTVTLRSYRRKRGL